jgi:hypothetical protein
LETQKQSFLAAHPDAVIGTSLTNNSPALLRDWHVVVFDYHGFVADFPPTMRHQPRRLLYAARTYGGYTFFLESSPFYPDFATTFLPAVDKLVCDLFPDQP